MESYFLTDTGRVREHNEDSVTILKNINEVLLTIINPELSIRRDYIENLFLYFLFFVLVL